MSSVMIGRSRRRRGPGCYSANPTGPRLARGERQGGAGGDVVGVLEHGPAFVGVEPRSVPSERTWTLGGRSPESRPIRPGPDPSPDLRRRWSEITPSFWPVPRSTPNCRLGRGRAWWPVSASLFAGALTNVEQPVLKIRARRRSRLRASARELREGSAMRYIPFDDLVGRVRVAVTYMPSVFNRGDETSAKSPLSRRRSIPIDGAAGT